MRRTPQEDDRGFNNFRDGPFDDYPPPRRQPRGEYHEDRGARDEFEEGGARRSMKTDNSNYRLYISLRKIDGESNEPEYKKLIIITPANHKISMLKRQVESEFADLFPQEPTFICSKLEDSFGYALSNNSFVYELMKNGDRLTAYPEKIPGVGETGPGGISLGSDVTEMLQLLRSVEQSVCNKMANADLRNSSAPEEEVLQAILPLGFSTSKVIIHNTAVILVKLLSAERLYVLEHNPFLCNLLVLVINHWLNDLVISDSYILNATIELLEIAIKLTYFCKSFHSPGVLAQLMNVSKFEITSSQAKSKILKILSYLSKGDYHNTYNPMKPVSRQHQTRLPPPQQGGGRDASQGYKPSFVKDEVLPGRGDAGRAGRGPVSADIRKTNVGGGQNDAIRVQEDVNFDDNPRYNVNSAKRVAIPDKLVKNTAIYNDYLTLLHPDNTPELINFALTNLSQIIDDCIDEIMADPEAYAKMLNLLEIIAPGELVPLQEKLLTFLAGGLNEARAKDGVNRKAVHRTLRAFNTQPTSLHPALYSLVEKHLKMSKFRVDLSTLISMVQSPYNVLQDLGVKAMGVISDPNFSDNPNYEIQFENHIKFLLELSINPKKSNEFRGEVVRVLANLALRDSLKPQLIYLKAVDIFVRHVRDNVNLECQRLGAKALLNLSINSKDVKLKIITELAEEIKKLYRNEMDSITASYLSSIIKK